VVLAAIMTIPKIHIPLFAIQLFCCLQSFGQKVDKLSGMTENETKFYNELRQQNVDTLLYVTYKSFAYNIKDSAFKTMFLWKVKGLTYKTILTDTIQADKVYAYDTTLLTYFFESKINSRQAKRTKYKYWKSHRLGWINPLSNFSTIKVFYDREHYSEMFLEPAGIYGDKQMNELSTKEICLLNKLKVEMYK
jgi:hypothetical protein